MASSKFDNVTYNNWAFDKGCLQRVLRQNLQNTPRGENEDIVFQTQKLLWHIMAAFDLANEDQLFDFIKSHTDFEFGIDFMQLQQMLVLVDRQLWGTEYSKKQRNRFLMTAHQATQYLIEQKYLPDAQSDELASRANEISRYALHKKTSMAATTKVKIDKAVQEETYQRIKLKYANEGESMFVDPDYPNRKVKYSDKIAVIQEYGTLIYPDGKQRDLGKALARQFYTQLMEDNGVKLKQNAKKKCS